MVNQELPGSLDCVFLMNHAATEKNIIVNGSGSVVIYIVIYKMDKPHDNGDWETLGQASLLLLNEVNYAKLS
jgi:hypothetical protein